MSIAHRRTAGEAVLVGDALHPPRMAEVRKTQEQFFRRPPWMAEVRKTQE